MDDSYDGGRMPYIENGTQSKIFTNGFEIANEHLIRRSIEQKNKKTSPHVNTSVNTKASLEK